MKEWKKRLKEGKIKGKILKRILTVRGTSFEPVSYTSYFKRFIPWYKQR